MITSHENITVLVTGANGFVGRALCSSLCQGGFEVIKAVRKATRSDEIEMGSIDGSTEWDESLKEVDVIVHLASRVHVMNDTVSDPLEAFRETNVRGTSNLAYQAASYGVRRFVFISSIKVNGENTLGGQIYRAGDTPAPTDAYGISKCEAELALHKVSQQTGLEVVIIRPPLIYGPGVKANFKSMIKWVSRGIPLPFGLINNNRSLVYIDNLTDLISICVSHPAAVNQTFLVSDGVDVSTTDLLIRIGKALDRPAKLINLPVSLLIFFASLLKKKAVAQRLFGSLQVDITKTTQVLGWRPRVSINDGLVNTVKDFKK